MDELRLVTFTVLVLTILSETTSLSSPPKITLPDKKKTMDVSKNANHTLKCQADGSPTPTYKWTVNGGDITLANVHVDSTAGTLDIVKFTDKTKGNYQCVAENEISPGGDRAVAMSATITLRLIKMDDPWPDGDTSTQNFDEGSYVSLTCDNHPVSVPTAKYSWYLAQGDESKGQVTEEGRKYVDEDGTLHFAYITKGDENGNLRYKCGIYNSELNMIRLGSEKDVTVNEAKDGIPQTAPTNRFKTDPAKFLRTKTAELECVFSGNPIPTITWFDKNGNDATLNPRMSIVDGSGGRKLAIENLEEEDEGEYRCRGTNTVSSAEETINLDVTSSPIWVQSLSSQTGIEGRDVLLHCRARPAINDPALAQPIWFKNGEVLPIENTDKYSFSNQGQNMLIKDLDKAKDILCYQCNVSNAEGFEFADGCINVVEPIVVTSHADLEQIVDKGTQINLTVIGTTDPGLVLEYRWGFNNITYEVGILPPNVTCNETTREAYINTSALTDAQFHKVLGTYYITLFHRYENVTVPINVTLDEAEVIPVVAASGGLWWIAIIIAIIILIIIILLIACIIFRFRDRGTYPLDKKERANDIDPEKDLENGGFHDLSRALEDDDYPGSNKAPLVNPNFDYDDDDDNLTEKDTESLEAYGGLNDSDMAKFNEDGSFIGQYKSKQKTSQA